MHFKSCVILNTPNVQALTHGPSTKFSFVCAVQKRSQDLFREEGIGASSQKSRPVAADLILKWGITKAAPTGRLYLNSCFSSDFSHFVLENWKVLFLF